MQYKYEFDDSTAGNVTLTRADYVVLQEAYRALQDDLEAWNMQALDHGAIDKPYKQEVADLSHMIEWGEEQLGHAEKTEVVVRRISVGSLRYAKAALVLMIQRKREDRAEKLEQGWPDAVLRSFDHGIDRISKIAEVLKVEPSAVLWEVIPKRDREMTSAGAFSENDWDVFVSHASEDKEAFARPLANGLRSHGLSVWFDEFTMSIGDSLRRSIDGGLARSHFGVVVISPSFLSKEWPQKELDGLVAREVDGIKVILPVWHNIAAEGIRRYSPTLADKLAASSEEGLDDVVDKILEAVGKGGAGVQRRLSARSKPPSDVRVTLRGPRQKARFVIENLGPSVVRNLEFEVDGSYGDSSPLVRGDFDKKLPVEILRPGERVELLAFLSVRMGTTFNASWSWREPDGRTQRISEKVSLEKY